MPAPLDEATVSATECPHLSDRVTTYLYGLRRCTRCGAVQGIDGVWRVVR